MPEQLVFSDDFSDGIWTKYAGNPVLVRSQPWAESDYICEPNVLFEDGLFRVWFSQMFPGGRGHGTALGYATSPDGFTWTKHPGNPVLTMPGGEVHRPSVMKHGDTYYCFAVQNENGGEAATMRRWSSRDGMVWGGERLVLRCSQAWEGGLSNMAVVVDEDGTWRMLYTGADKPPAPSFGYAWSRDGLEWVKHEGNPVITGFYGGDPALHRIGELYYTWHSHSFEGGLRICCRSSPDMIDWEPVGRHPQIGYTQVWERGVPEAQGGTTAGYYGHLTDATLCEANGRVFLLYQGAQTPLGVATFEGTFADLAARLRTPPLSQWEESPYGMVENGTLKLADNGSDRNPLVAAIAGAGDRYALDARIQCYAGATHRVSVVMRYGNASTFARFWLHDAGHTYYQECINGLFSTPLNVGPSSACDSAPHDWRVEVHGAANRLSIDGRRVGECESSPALLRKLTGPVYVGFSTLDAYASIEQVQVLACE